MKEAERIVLGLIQVNWPAYDPGPPREEIVRQAMEMGVGQEEAEKAIDGLRMVGEAYEMRPGLLAPVERLDFLEVAEERPGRSD